MPELASAWVTIAASTRGMESDIRRAMDRVERGARFTPRIDTGRLGSEGARAGRDFARRFNSSAGSLGNTLMGTFGGVLSAQAFANLAATGARAYVGAFQEVLSTGLDFEKTLNNFKGVTRATTAEMQAMQATARSLGSDTTLAGASASDAALAMTELAKAGFSVNEAMGAARGTLELATAGQIDAAKAAEIQANAMNAFGLGAESAAHTTDLLANAAIASSADIPDLGLALQQVGGIAHGFGENLDDTIAALAMFANAGIKGSDAGTLLKTTMQSITDQGNPAQGAIEALNLSLYDFDTHQFVGFREMFRQLDEAKKRMNPEDFQAQANILFGSDAMRSAMLGNAESFDQMLQNLQRVGAGAELAEAQMQGLPGAVEAFSNTMESVKLGAFDAIGPVATESLNGLVDWMSTHQPEIIGFFTTMAEVTLETGAAIGHFAEGATRAFAVFLEATAGTFGRAIQTLGEGGLRIADILNQIPGMSTIAGNLAQASAKAQLTGISLRTVADNARESADGMGVLADGMESASRKVHDLGTEAQASSEQTRLYKETFSQLAGAVESVPGSKDIVLKENSPEVLEKIRQLGFTVQNLPDGRQVIRLEYRDPAGNIVDPNQLRVPGFIPAVPGETRPPRGGGRAAGGAIFGPGGPKDDRIPAWLSNGEHVLTAKDVEAMGGQGGVYAFRSGLHRNGGGDVHPLAVPWGVDPHGSKDREASAGPFGPWWDMDWLPPENPAEVGPGAGKWWYRGPTGKKSKWKMPPVGNKPGQRKPLPGAPRFGPTDPRYKPWGFANGGAVTGPYDALSYAQSIAGAGYGPSAGPQVWDCSGFMSDIYAILTGKPYTGGERYFTTEADFEALGFIKGYDPNSAFNIGVSPAAVAGGNAHMAGTLLGYNVESGGGTGGGPTIGQGAAGATDSQFAQQYHLPIPMSAAYGPGSSYDDIASYGYGAPDLQKIADAEENLRRQRADVLIQEQQLRELDADATESQKMSAQEQLRKAKADEAKAQRELDEARRGEPLSASDAQTAGSKSGGMGEQLGQNIISGLLQGLGFDGSVFSNPLEWPNVKSGIALANWGGGMLKSLSAAQNGGSTTTMASSGGGALPGLSLPGVSDFLNPTGPGSTTPIRGAAATTAGQGGAAQYVINGNVGMDPRSLTQRFDAGYNQSWRRNMAAVRPR